MPVLFQCDVCRTTSRSDMQFVVLVLTAREARKPGGEPIHCRVLPALWCKPCARDRGVIAPASDAPGEAWEIKPITVEAAVSQMPPDPFFVPAAPPAPRDPPPHEPSAVKVTPFARPPSPDDDIIF